MATFEGTQQNQTVSRLTKFRAHQVTLATQSVVRYLALCGSVLQCVAVCCSVWQCVVVMSLLSPHNPSSGMLRYVAVCCSVLQRAAACCSMLQCVVVCGSVWQCAAVCGSVLQSRGDPRHPFRRLVCCGVL